jgi:zinc/manganese transport system permease protein
MHAYLSAFIELSGLPLLACLIVSGILVYLGMHVVERKVIFVDLALAQIAALGVMWAILMGYDHEHDTVAVTLYSLGFTMLGAVVFSITRTRDTRVPHEALIGIIYVAASAGGLVLADRFALGTEALKELIAGRVALVTPAMVGKLAVTCAVLGAGFFALHRRLVRISTDPEAAEAAGMSVRAWDFVFYLLFGVLITQTVAVLGVLPVFAYLVIPAVAAAFLFSSVRARLLFGWGFASVGSFVGLETARVSGLDPGPTLVCIFSAALIVLGLFLYLRRNRFRPLAIARMAGVALIFVGFLGATWMFRKPARSDEMVVALEFASSQDSGRARQAMDSFRKFPGERSRWQPLVVAMLERSDPVVREQAAVLLGESRAADAIAGLTSRLGVSTEPDPSVREAVVGALVVIGSSAAVPALAAAAPDEEEADLVVAMCAAVFALADPAQVEEVRKAVELLLRLGQDDQAPRAARADATALVRRHLDAEVFAAATADPGYWAARRSQLGFDPVTRRFTAPIAP